MLAVYAQLPSNQVTITFAANYVHSLLLIITHLQSVIRERLINGKTKEDSRRRLDIDSVLAVSIVRAQ